MEIRTLRYFLAVAREENMTRASEYLHVSQPTLSKQVQSLENELGYETAKRACIPSTLPKVRDENVFGLEEIPGFYTDSQTVVKGTTDCFQMIEMLFSLTTACTPQAPLPRL